MAASVLALYACASGGGDLNAALARGQMKQALAAYEHDGAQPEALRHIAGAVIEREAWSADPARRARCDHARPGAGLARAQWRLRGGARAARPCRRR
jgi:hypothetical protein